jgi:hypothetical protein
MLEPDAACSQRLRYGRALKPSCTLLRRRLCPSTGAVNSLARKSKVLKEGDPSLAGDYIREGLGAIVSVKVGWTGYLAGWQAASPAGAACCMQEASVQQGSSRRWLCSMLIAAMDASDQRRDLLVTCNASLRPMPCNSMEPSCAGARP